MSPFQLGAVTAPRCVGQSPRPDAWTEAAPSNAAGSSRLSWLKFGVRERAPAVSAQRAQGQRRPRPPSHISIIVRDGSSSAGIANCRLCAAASSMPGPLLHENTSRGTPVVAAAESSPLEELQGVPKNAVRMRL